MDLPAILGKKGLMIRRYVSTIVFKIFKVAPTREKIPLLFQASSPYSITSL